MEKKDPIKISLPIFITVIVILVACVSGILMYMQNQKLDKEIANLKEDISKTQEEKNELQERLNNVSKISLNNNEITKTENDRNNTETIPINAEITVKQKEEYFDTIATLYSDNKVTIKLTDKSKMWKYNVEDWKNAEYDKEYEVEGIDGEVSKILLTNLPSSDVVPAVIILCKNGTVSYVDISSDLQDALKKKTAIKNFIAKEKVTNIENIVDIKNKTSELIVAVDHNGKEFPLWEFYGVE